MRVARQEKGTQKLKTSGKIKWMSDREERLRGR